VNTFKKSKITSIVEREKNINAMLKMGNWLLNCKSHKESLKAYKSEEVTLVPELNLDKNNAFQRSYYDNCDKCMFFK